MTNTNLKALAKTLYGISELDYLEPSDNAAVFEAAALLTALAEPLGEEPERKEIIYGSYKDYVSAEYADYFRTAYLQARAESITLKAELAILKQER